MPRPLTQLPIATPLGTFVAFYSKYGLAELNLPVRPEPGRGLQAASTSDTEGTRKQHECRAPEIPTDLRAWHRVTQTALAKIISGKSPGLLPPLDLDGTEFQKSVWREMLKIPFGKTKSYGEIAKAIGNPKAVRAVGAACGANHIPVFVPCHRVLAANNKIGGFSSGLGWKCKLLEIEGVSIGAEAR